MRIGFPEHIPKWRNHFLPSKALGHLHVFEGPSFEEGTEGCQSVVECNRSWRFGFVFMPTAELGDDPGGPSEGVFGVGVFLASGLALASLIEQGDELDLVGCEGEAGRPGIGAGAG